MGDEPLIIAGETAFAALREWRDERQGRSGRALAAITAETPEQVESAADVRVRATEGVAEALARLLGAVGG